jgi:hypothetical protein
MRRDVGEAVVIRRIIRRPVCRPRGRIWILVVLGLLLTFGIGSRLGVSEAMAAQQQAAEPPPGTAAPPALVNELRAALGLAIQRFEARDVPGVLRYISERYRTGPFTKPRVQQELIAIYSVYDRVRAQVQIDEVRLVGEHAWVYSTGEILGQLPLLGTWVRFLAWERELEVARREPGGWLLFGYQQ